MCETRRETQTFAELPNPDLQHMVQLKVERDKVRLGFFVISPCFCFVLFVVLRLRCALVGLSLCFHCAVHALRILLLGMYRHESQGTGSFDPRVWVRACCFGFMAQDFFRVYESRYVVVGLTRRSSGGLDCPSGGGDCHLLPSQLGRRV